MATQPATWETLDWEALDRLRQRFLRDQPGKEDYWSSAGDVASYDFTFGQRIGWKWDAVIKELKKLRWRPPAGTLMDWGCGSGIASRRMIDWLGGASFERLRLWDRSVIAREFAAQCARKMYPGLEVESVVADDEQPIGTLVISHVLNELDEAAGVTLRSAIDRAASVVWVEPGTFADSRALVALREALRDRFVIIAPCPHQGACGLLNPTNERHWCHHFATPPSGIMADADWVRFAKRVGIDLRSLPYSYLVLERPELRGYAALQGLSRTLGNPRVYKGFLKILGCRESGVDELELQKRDAPDVFKAFKSGTASSLWQWEEEGNRRRIRRIAGAGESS